MASQEPGAPRVSFSDKDLENGGQGGQDRYVVVHRARPCKNHLFRDGSCTTRACVAPAMSSIDHVTDSSNRSRKWSQAPGNIEDLGKSTMWAFLDASNMDFPPLDEYTALQKYISTYRDPKLAQEEGGAEKEEKPKKAWQVRCHCRRDASLI